MKTTQERLSESFCVPKTESEWNLLGLKKPEPWDFFYNNQMKYVHSIKGAITYGRYPYEKAISVYKYADLSNDSIVPWRLKEDGFNITDSGKAQLIMKSPIQERHGEVGIKIVFDPLSKEAFVTLHIGGVAFPFDGVKTYTNLIALFELIG
jgi:hypothetical protein